MILGEYIIQGPRKHGPSGVTKLVSGIKADFSSIDELIPDLAGSYPQPRLDLVLIYMVAEPCYLCQ